VTAPADRAAAGWAGERERSNRWVLRLMRWIAIGAGRNAARALLHPIALYYLMANAKARRASQQYFARVLDRPVRLADTYRHIHRFASTILDRVYLLQGRFNEFDVVASGAQAVHASLDRGRGVMLAGAHFGSFEALRASGEGRGAPVAMLMYEDNARLINSTLAAVAPHAQLHTIALGRPGAMLALRRWLDDGGLAGLLADRSLPPTGDRGDRSRTHLIEFLGSPARFSDGPFRLAALLHHKVVFMAGLHDGGRRYDLRFVELADFSVPAEAGAPSTDQRVLDALHRYVALLETLCRESPYNWFNFYDFWATDAAAKPSTPAAR
jgi:predicted LPLAT superfamily acyltransferase